MNATIGDLLRRKLEGTIGKRIRERRTGPGHQPVANKGVVFRPPGSGTAARPPIQRVAAAETPERRRIGAAKFVVSLQLEFKSSQSHTRQDIQVPISVAADAQEAARKAIEFVAAHFDSTVRVIGSAHVETTTTTTVKVAEFDYGRPLRRRRNDDMEFD